MKTLRSQEWFARQDKSGFICRSWLKSQGAPHDLFEGRPVIAICNTWSDLTPCNGHFRELAEFVKRGAWEVGGFPLEFPVMSLGESLLRPTAMLFRNLASMDVEESIRGNPLDAVVLLMGCDKTTPSLLIGAASCDLPSIRVSGGPMLSGKFHGCDLGSGTGVWQISEQVRSGEMKLSEFFEAESCMHRSKGHCMTMGTASTMASMVEALGMRILDLGDVTRDQEMKLVCPVNKLGKVDICIGSHHGGYQSGSPPFIYGITPRVAIMDNGARKGGTPSAWEILKKSPGLEDLWQLHYVEESGPVHNVPPSS
jgi:dihydroxyacid dehydratase/phosphogluconate dehydratase